ncbi:MAG TPA: hypothetical protein VM818_22885 [Vicinamibacterales bacterium]|jgi:hypothetical protein|nr:hypothetical protein [Vicinamibacterales bacterium]
MKTLRYAATAFGSAALAMTLVMADADRAFAAETMKLTGCLARGEGDGAGYLLFNVPAGVAQASSSSTATPGAIGTTASFANVFYWLRADDDLKPHIGHLVEVEGELENEIDDGEIKIDRKDEWTEIEVKSDGREMKARVPSASVAPGPDPDRKIRVLVRRLDVEKVRMLEAVCR